PSAVCDAEAGAQRDQDHVGPALAKAILTSEAGLSPQEPPVPLSGTDPVEWMAAFVKPVPGGSDRGRMARIDPNKMPDGEMPRVIVHWTAGTYKASPLDREHYHVLIEGDGTIVYGI